VLVEQGSAVLSNDISTVICSAENTVQELRLFHDSLNVSSMLHYCCIIVDLHLRIKTSYSVFLCIPYFLIEERNHNSIVTCFYMGY